MEAKRNREIFENWGELSETIKNPILGYLLFDNAAPKRFTDIHEYCKQKHICTLNTLWVYLDKLEHDGKIIKIPYGKRFKYALANYKELRVGVRKNRINNKETNQTSTTIR